jgi:hypothetical protein
MCHCERSACAVCGLCLTMPTVARCLSGLLFGSNALLQAPELRGFLGVLFILRHPELLGPSHSFRPLNTSGSGEFRSFVGFVSLSDGFSNPLQVSKRSLAEIRSNLVKPSIQFLSAESDAIKAAKSAGPVSADALADELLTADLSVVSCCSVPTAVPAQTAAARLRRGAQFPSR